MPVWLFFALGLFGYALRAVDYFSAIPGDLGDSRFNSVILEHVFRWVAGHDKSLWSPTFFFPFEGTLAFSDNHFGSVPSYILLRLAGLDRAMAFDWWFLVGIFLNYFAAYIVIRRLGFSGFGSAAGAFAFAFALPALAQEGHEQLVYRFAIPFAFVAFWEMISTRRLYLLWLVAFWTAVQFFCSIYLGIFLVFLLASTFAAMLVRGTGRDLFSSLWMSLRSENQGAVVILGIVPALSVGAVLWLLYNYQIVRLDYGFARSRAEIASMLPRLASYLIADRLPLASWLRTLTGGVPMRNEQQLFCGFGVLALGLIGLVSSWSGKHFREIGRTASLALAFIFLATLSVHGISTYFLLTHLPGLTAIRAVTRIVLVMMLPVALLVAIGSDALLRHAGPARLKRAVVAIAVLCLLGVEVAMYQPYNTSITQWLARQTDLKARLPRPLPADPIIFVTEKPGEPFFLAELDGMILAQDLGVPTLNGYSGNIPPGYLEPLPCLSYLHRLYGYADHRHLPRSAMEAIAQRVVVVPGSACPDGPLLVLEGPVAADQVKQIGLSIDDVKIVDGQLTASIIVKNGSATAFNTISTKGPVRLSWRFLDTAADGGRLPPPGWDARKDLAWTIPPGESRKTDITVGLPKARGRYLFEVSIVQDGVAWFHDLGMKIATSPVVVGSPDGAGADVPR